MAVTVDSPKLSDLIDRESEVVQVATGFMFTEGPLWVPAEGALHFSDMPGDKRRSWHPQRGVTVLRDPSNRCVGMSMDSRGAIVVCEHVTSHLVREWPEGRSEVLASHYGGKELNSPNDVIVANDDSVIFTDPDFGRTVPAVGLERKPELDFRGVFRVRAEGGEPQLLADDFAEPNGLCFSPDETLLYVNDTPRAHIRVFDVGPGYVLSNARIFAEGIGEGKLELGGLVDGMKVDEHGNVYVTGPDGIWVFDPAGERLGVIHVPEDTANLAWGDDDWKSLYITASTSVYRVGMRVAGNRLPYMSADGSA